MKINDVVSDTKVRTLPMGSLCRGLENDRLYFKSEETRWTLNWGGLVVKEEEIRAQHYEILYTPSPPLKVGDTVGERGNELPDNTFVIDNQGTGYVKADGRWYRGNWDTGNGYSNNNMLYCTIKYIPETYGS